MGSWGGQATLNSVVFKTFSDFCNSNEFACMRTEVCTRKPSSANTPMKTAVSYPCPLHFLVLMVIYVKEIYRHRKPTLYPWSNSSGFVHHELSQHGTLFSG